MATWCHFYPWGLSKKAWRCQRRKRFNFDSRGRIAVCIVKLLAILLMWQPYHRKQRKDGDVFDGVFVGMFCCMYRNFVPRISTYFLNVYCCSRWMQVVCSMLIYPICLALAMRSRIFALQPLGQRTFWILLNPLNVFNALGEARKVCQDELEEYKSSLQCLWWKRCEGPRVLFLKRRRRLVRKAMLRIP